MSSSRLINEEAQPESTAGARVGQHQHRQEQEEGDDDEAGDGGQFERKVGDGCAGDGSHMFVFTNEKAGMKGMKADEKERANRIIYEMSKNSSYFRQAEQQDKKVDAKVTEMKTRLRALDATTKAHLTRQADKATAQLERQRELDSICMVVDMDMFFAAVEIRDRPELADKPVAVGGNSMISTTNYHARKKGVRSAMPGFIGRKLCPDLVFVRSNFEKYTKVAEQIRAIFREYDPRMRSHSLDEAYLNVTQALAGRLDEEDRLRDATAMVAPTAAEFLLDLSAIAAERGAGGAGDGDGDDSKFMPNDKNNQSRNLGERASLAHRRRPTEEGHRGYYRARNEDRDDEDEDYEAGEGDKERVAGGEERRARMFKAARAMAEEIRGRIQEATQLTASCGIGPNFMLAKIASDWNKPNGQYCVGGDRAEILQFLHDLPVRKVGGVGKVTEKCLREAIGVVTCGDLYRERAACMYLMTPHTSRWLLKVSLGIASADHDVATEQAEAAGAITRKQISKERTFGELHRPQDLLAKCREICESLAAEMAKKSLGAKTVGLKIKTTEFNVRTQDHTGQAYLSTADELYAIASSLLQREIREASGPGGGGALRLRLMGVKASSFRGQAGIAPLPGQATLDGFLGGSSSHAGAVAEVPRKVVASRELVNDPWLVVTEEESKRDRGGSVAAAEGDAGSPSLERAWGGETRMAEDRATKKRRRFECNSDPGRTLDSGDGLGVGASDPITAQATRGTLPAAPVKPSSPRSRPTAQEGARQTQGWRQAYHGKGYGERDSAVDASLAPHPPEAPTAAMAMPAPAAVVNCPLCGELLGIVSNALLNRHVDACLGVGSESGEDYARRHGGRKGGGGGRGRLGPRGTKGERTKVSTTSGIERFLSPRGRT